MADRLGDGPIEPRYHALMNALANGIEEVLNGPKGETPRETGFVLLCFPFTNAEGGTDGRCNYISNASRQDIVVLLREQLARFEGMPEASGRA